MRDMKIQGVKMRHKLKTAQKLLLNPDRWLECYPRRQQHGFRTLKLNSKIIGRCTYGVQRHIELYGVPDSQGKGRFGGRTRS